MTISNKDILFVDSVFCSPLFYVQNINFISKYQNSHFSPKGYENDECDLIYFILFQLDDQIANFAISMWNDQKIPFWDKISLSWLEVKFC